MNENPNHNLFPKYDVIECGGWAEVLCRVLTGTSTWCICLVTVVSVANLPPKIVVSAISEIKCDSAINNIVTVTRVLTASVTFSFS